MSTDEKIEGYTSFQQAIVDFMHFVCQKIKEQLTQAQLEDFMAKVDTLEKDKNFEKKVSLILKPNPSVAINVDGFGLAKEYHVPAIFLIIRKMLPQSVIPTSLEFDDVQKDLRRIEDCCPLLFNIGECIDLS